MSKFFIIPYYYLISILRNLFWKIFLGEMGKGVKIYGHCDLLNPFNIYIGNNSTINHRVIIGAREKVIIGNNVHISVGSIINSGFLDYKKNINERSHNALPVIIEDGVWIAAGAIINPGVTIGKNSIIGAGAVVTHDIPPNSLAYGVPAEKRKEV